MMSIAEFCELHYACKEGREWALANCKAMADVWVTACPGWLVWVATRPDVLDDRTLRLFAVFCARSVEHLLTDQRSRDAIDVAERFAKGEATAEELSAARDAARDAASYAASDAARAASDAASDAAWSAARDAAWSAARSAARDAARSKQADWLRKNAAPNFERGEGDG